MGLKKNELKLRYLFFRFPTSKENNLTREIKSNLEPEEGAFPQLLMQLNQEGVWKWPRAEQCPC